MIRKVTFEVCFESAKKHTKISDWASDDPAAYVTARRRGWSSKCTAHMPIIKRVASFETCVASALRHECKSAWKGADPGAFSTAVRHGWINRCTAHMPAKKKLIPWWKREHTMESCQASALKCGSLKAWRKIDSGSYSAARKNGWLTQCVAHMGAGYLLLRKHSLESVCASAAPFLNLVAWKAADPKAFRQADYNDWLAVATAHMARVISEDDANAFKYTVYKVEADDGFVYYGITHKSLRSRKWQHLNCSGSAVFEHLKTRPGAGIALSAIAEGLNALEAVKIEKELISKDSTRILNRNSGGTLGGVGASIIDFKNALSVA